MSEIVDKAKGSVLGLAWGDVLGCPIEGWKEFAIEKVYGTYPNLPKEHNLQSILSLSKKYLPKRKIGVHSDDTQQALALIHCCLSCGIEKKHSFTTETMQHIVTKLIS
eukprot:TRINITY_DN2480_c0_g1_i3.p2 TRINITY_DN2480_c0_g1~~TRINITY_DN2480_c0_g1_i3.p2  ORF type:complete len:108 (-),score=17.53 TRINITY_DN2480_c0_g1_i3:104-427(-)